MNKLRMLGLNSSIVTAVAVLLTLLVSLPLAYFGHPWRFTAFNLGGGISFILFCASAICMLAECWQRPRRGLRAKDLHI